MARVMIHCPETGEPVYTGMTFDWSAFETLRIGRRFVGARQHFIADRAALTPAGYRHSPSSRHVLPFSNFPILNTPMGSLARDHSNVRVGSKAEVQRGTRNVRFWG